MADVKQLPAPANEIVTGATKQPETEPGYVMNQQGLDFLVASLQEIPYKMVAHIFDFLQKGLTQVTIEKTPEQKEG